MKKMKSMERKGGSGGSGGSVTMCSEQFNRESIELDPTFSHFLSNNVPDGTALGKNTASDGRFSRLIVSHVDLFILALFGYPARP